MAAILLDLDGVVLVSGEPIPGAIDALAELRRQGHRLRFVTNNTTRPRAMLAAELRSNGIELDDDELQTTAAAAARALAGKRVVALVMAALVEDLEGIELVGDGADAVLGLPSTVASTPEAYSSPATNAPESSSGPREVCHQRFLCRQYSSAPTSSSPKARARFM